MAQISHRTDDALVLFDPLVPADETAEYWQFLKERRGASDLSVHILLTAPWHERSTAVVAARLGATVWAHPAGHDRLSLQPAAAALPEGIEVVVPGGMEEGEVAFYVASTCTLIVAEFLLGEDGALRVLPSPAVEDCEAFRRSLRGLLGMRIDRVLVAHGDPILNHGHARIRDALQAFSAGLAD